MHHVITVSSVLFFFSKVAAREMPFFLRPNPFPLSPAIPGSKRSFFLSAVRGTPAIGLMGVRRRGDP